MICRHCGNALNITDTICPRCGFIQSPEALPSSKSKVIAGLLGLFFGWLGLHNFYLGFTGKGVAQLLITIISLGTLFWISLIWGFVEGIFCLSGKLRLDAQGKQLR